MEFISASRVARERGFVKWWMMWIKIDLAAVERTATSGQAAAAG
ncbi:MAG: hypothetical protein V4689_05105 [Verrucomicrobiota bacterium]